MAEACSAGSVGGAGDRGAPERRVGSGRCTSPPEDSRSVVRVSSVSDTGGRGGAVDLERAPPSADDST